MKSFLILITAFLLALITQIAQSLTCSTPFQQAPYGSGSYCAKCDTTCNTCSGSSINLCATCPTDFTLDTATGICTAPMNTSVNTVTSSYHTYGFQKEGSWSGGDSSSWSNCNTITVLHGSSASVFISTTHSLDSHYKIRIRVALWSFSGAASFNISVTKTTGGASISGTSTTASNTGYVAGQYYIPYCNNSFAVNYEVFINDGTKDITVTFNSSSNDWGLNEYVMIQYLCNQADCASCTGATASDCTSCIDAHKQIYTTPGPCLCNFTAGYYAYPTNNSTYFCVNPCPNLPTGQYYGDNSTKTCVSLCPTDSSNPPFNLTFASDTYGFCVKLCPLQTTFGGISVDMYYDLVNRKCTPICPSGQPYSLSVDHACYSACPLKSSIQYYKLKTDMTCVPICPNITQNGTVTIPLYRDSSTFTCVEVCPAGTWGQLNQTNGDRSCVSNCTSPLFHDNSTGRPLCTQICPIPNYFGDTLAMPRSCVLVCTFPTFGDVNANDSSRFCVAKCNNSYYGLQTGNRTCVKTCPSGTWAERISQVCVLAPFNCLQVNITFASLNYTGNYTFNSTINSFADSSIHKCIYANQPCENGNFKLNSTYTCETSCPNSTFAHPITFWCVDKCYGIYFADSMVNRCVQLCSPGYYADVGSGNKCVSRCNQTGGYPYKDDAIRRCVDICTDGYADPLAQACVFACSPGLYLNNSASSQLTCVTECGGNYFAYNNSDSGICVLTCPQEPPLFGDVVDSIRLCVQVCQVGYFGDQMNNSFRHCVNPCPNTTFAQNDSLRRCVTRCNVSTYGRQSDWTCVNQLDCQLNYAGDNSTNLCVQLCPQSYGTFTDNISKLCLSTCPIYNTTIYYADRHIRWCVPTCNSSELQFGSNGTRTCQTKCLDLKAYADAQSSRRYCIGTCTNVGTTLYYRDNFTMSCVRSFNCSDKNFGDNATQHCVQNCSIVNGSQTWGYVPDQTCLKLCYASTWGDNSTGVPLCVTSCPSLPPKWAYDGPIGAGNISDMTVMLCVQVCPAPFFGANFSPTNRSCDRFCPRPPLVTPQTFAYDGNRRCLQQCPNTTYADYVSGVCFNLASNCSQQCPYTWSNCSSGNTTYTNYRWADDYNTSCTYLCTATPWDTYGDNLTFSCTTKCSTNSYADNYTGTRICVAICPGQYDNTTGDITTTSPLYDSYGDNNTQRCVLHCQSPGTYADWQTHLCNYRCTGDDSSTTPTYANVKTNRCVIALRCPQVPDKYFGQNITRLCRPACIYNSTNSSYSSYADNITRTCIPKCYKYTNASTPLNYTMFYGDDSTMRPACVIACPKVPRLFGENGTHLCKAECPDHQYGDQTGNRTCVSMCPNIGGVTWFSQLTQRICVTVCENNTYGNYYSSINQTGPHCQTVGTDCNDTQFGDKSTHMCVAICPISMNYYGDISTQLCTEKCPTINNTHHNTTNLTAGINLPDGPLFADDKTRLCVIMCPLDWGFQGTFGDNSTNTCVERCPNKTYGDANTVNRYCVPTCTGGAYADDLTMLCVDMCPANPPTFGYSGNWTCLETCPLQLWANNILRTCVSICNPNFRLTGSINECVDVCPSQPDLYGDQISYNCTAVCTGGKFADPSDRLCKGSCSNSLFQFNYRCVKLCPKGFYANSTNDCVAAFACDGNTFGQNQTTKCVNPCPFGSYADQISRYCIAVCPDGSYGQNMKCVNGCAATNTASNITQLCTSICPNYTYSYNNATGNFCVQNCSGTTYQNDQTHICDAGCPDKLYADPTTHRCVAYCPTGYYRKSSPRTCVLQNAGCGTSEFADFVTGNCTTNCSTGFWGYTGNYTCLKTCPGTNLFGYESTSERTCYQPTQQPSPLFADSVSGKFVTVCPQLPIIYFGDKNRHTCVSVCNPYLNISYYGDPLTRQCQTGCGNTTLYAADNYTHLCTLKCSYGTFRNNYTAVCVSPCPTNQGFGDYTTRICVATCPQLANTFGFYNTSSGSRLCIEVCPDNYFSQPVYRTCQTNCLNSPTMYYAYNRTKQCLLSCPDSFADDNNNRCVDKCWSALYPNADNSTNKCVYTCPSNPDYYADDHICVFYCTTAGFFADSSNRTCLSRCQNITIGVDPFNQYGDVKTGRCQRNCSEGTWGDNQTNKCVSHCPDGSFADNTTGKCVAECPKVENIYADMQLNVCAYTCSKDINGHQFYGSQLNQTCIHTCEIDYWGDPTTTLCTKLCPVKIYSYGQNDSRTCVSSCVPYSGYADNYSRICRAFCQNNISVQTFRDTTTKACVQICPLGYFNFNDTNLCVTNCPNSSGLYTFADNFSRYCVLTCPDQPQSYGDVHSNICIYNCRFGEFSDNSTNLCVVVCPSLNNSANDYFGDPVNGRCVKWCTEGLFAQNDSRLCIATCPSGQYADNYTRRCVALCPSSQNTYGDSITHRCVRVCPTGWWARNDTQTCVSVCPSFSLGNGTETYSDNITKYCVAQCPFGYFGTNGTHRCVQECQEPEYGHHIGRVCVDILNCYIDNATSNVYYADSTSRTCVQKCPLTRWADTHIFRCVPICNSSIPEYRNNHTQMCVSRCPTPSTTVPDQYADDSTGNCVRTCPPNSYAQLTTRKCYAGCGIFLQFADNSTNRCVDNCNTFPYYYANNISWNCVLHCQGGQFSDNKSQTCVRYCPIEWQYFGQLHNFTCVSLCPAGQFADAWADRTCRSTCSNSYFSDNYTSACVAHCKLIRPFYYQDVSLGHGVCVHVCPGQSYGFNPDQTCKYQNNVTLASTCPGAYYADRASRVCVQLCPNGTFSFLTTKYCELTCNDIYYADPVLRKCVTTCSPNLFKYDQSPTVHKCVQYCPSTLFAQNATTGVDAKCVSTCTGLVGNPTTKTCQTYCPHPYFADWGNNICTTNCTPLISYMPNRTCMARCEPPYYGNMDIFTTYTCDLLCPLNKFGRNDTQQCSSNCPNLSYADPSIRICVANCPSYPLLYADDRYNKCLPECSFPLFGFLPNLTCLSSCPTIGNMTYLADDFNRLCVLSCVNRLISYADYSNNVCTQFCPNGTFASNYTKQCVNQCPNIPNDTFSDNNTHICMDVCLPGSFGNHDTLNCVANCTLPYFADPTTRTCVKICPSGYFAYNITATCRLDCPVNSFADSVTHRCMGQCPALHNLFNYRGNSTCLTSCPPGFYANTDINECVSICNSSNGMFSYGLTNICVRECPIPYKGYAPNKTCILNCPPQRYFYDVTINVCSLCNQTCLICTSLSSCLQCLPGKNLFNGYCEQSCKPTATLITYADLSGVCVEICPITYFGDVNDYACKQDCGVRRYGEATTRLCTACPSTCASCTSPTYCLTCQISATMAIDHMCYSDCNSTSKYSYNGTCYNTCPNMTYLTYTNVLCTACASICNNCMGSATNCTSCSSTYYYNSTCLTTCPTGYYGSPSLQCLLCNSSVNATTGCSQPLSFTTTMGVQNFQYVITLQFNQNVTIQKQLQDILKINLKINRLLQTDIRQLQIGTLINNGIPFTYQILSNGTIKLYLQINVNLINPTFSVSITDPASVISTTTGVSLQNVQSLLSIAMIQYYPIDEGKQAGTNFPAKFVAIIVLLLYMFTFVLSDTMVRPLQILQVFFMHCLIDVKVPANLYYSLYQLKLTILEFTTNWFDSYFTTKSLYYDIPPKIVDIFVDFVFLRNLGQIFVFIVIFACFWAAFMLLGNKRLIPHKIWQPFFASISDKRYGLMVINDVLSLFFLPILFFSFMQLNNLNGGGIYSFNAFVTVIFLIAAILMPVIWLLLWIKRTPEQVNNKMWFLTLRVKYSDNIRIHMHQLQSDEHLKSQKSDSKSSYQGESQQKCRSQLQSIMYEFYLLLMAIWFVGLYNYPIIQLALLMVTNILFLGYLLIARPYLNAINMLFAVLTTLGLIVLQGIYMYFKGVQTTMYATDKTNVAFPYIVFQSVLFVLMILWALWRFVWECSFYWQKFKKTQVYLQFADHDYTGEKDQTQKFSEYQKIAQKVDAGLGDLIVEDIKQQLNEDGVKVIKVKKKVLKKKQKIQGRRKQIVQVLNQIPQEQQQGFIRVNQINVFDYDRLQNNSRKQEQPLKQRKRVIDDDIREMISDDSEMIPVHLYRNQEEEKKIDLEEGEIALRNIQNLSEINLNQQSEKKSEFPFIDIEEDHEEEEKMKEEDIEDNQQSQSYQMENEAKKEIQQEPNQQNQQIQSQEYQQINSQAISELKSENIQDQDNKVQHVQRDNQSQFQHPSNDIIELDQEIKLPEMEEESQKQQDVPKQQAPKQIKNIQDLLLEQQGGKNKKNLLFLFDDFDQDQ